MKLAEALILRADAQKRLEQLKHRLVRNAKVQEGESPSEDPQELLNELQRTLTEFTNLVKWINKTNSARIFKGEKTLTDALAERDSMAIKRVIVLDLIEAATIKQDRYTRSEVKFYTTLDVTKMQKEVDQLSKNYRELDSLIQQTNWNVDLIEEQ